MLSSICIQGGLGMEVRWWGEWGDENESISSTVHFAVSLEGAEGGSAG